MTAEARPALPGAQIVPEPRDAAWSLARDRRLAVFIRARLRMVERTGCAAEFKALGWVLTVLPAWAAAREREATDPTAAACLEALGWVLRHAAHSCWSRHPEWEPAFHPQAVAPHCVEVSA
ncbi:hypothetical protein [Streptomyces sp. NPDC001089]